MHSLSPVTAQYAVLLFACSFIGIYALDTSCSAINAYVHLTSLPHTHLNGTTLLSSYALFAPHSYYVPPTPFVSLDAATDNICNASGISTNISNKIVLLFESKGNCSVQSKIHVAQQNDARAVLMANNEPTNKVAPVAPGSDSVQTSIPMRSISLQDGETLLTQIELKNAQMFGEFGCFDSQYSSSLCVEDSVGDYWYVDGRYQRMTTAVNGHPVWFKDGISLSIAKLYIYLHVGDNTDDLRWVISYDPFFENEADIRLKCSESVHDPSLCTQWVGINDPYIFYRTKQSHFCAHYRRHWDCEEMDLIDTTFESADGITVSSGLCGVDTAPSSRLCISSDTKLLAPFMGEYYQYNPAKAIWMRETNECDHKPAVLMFDGVGFALLDPLNRDFIVTCFLDTELLASSEFDPSVCTEWKSIHDHSYNEENLVFNDQFAVTMDACVAPRAPCEAKEAPDAFCMTSNSLLNAMLSGTFVKTNVTGPEYGSPEYKRTQPMIHYDRHRGQKEEVDLYIWYRNEIISSRYTPQYEDYPDYRNWVLAARSLTDALKPFESGRNGRIPIYAICDGFAFGNPLNCEHWGFKTQRYQYLLDENVQMFESVNPNALINTAPVVPSAWPKYICVGLKDEGIEFGGTYSVIDSDFFVGGYELSTEEGSEPWEVKWIKRVNDNWDFEVFIEYEMDRGTWEIEGIWNDTEWEGQRDSKFHRIHDFYRKFRYDFKCDAWKHEVLNPVQCKVWYDEDYELLDNMYLYECAADDMITMAPTASPTVTVTTASPTCGDGAVETDGNNKAMNGLGGTITNGAIVLGVILCIVGVICMVISIWLWCKGRDNRPKRAKVVNANDDEMEIATQKETKYDMSPLNTHE